MSIFHMIPWSGDLQDLFDNIPHVRYTSRMPHPSVDLMDDLVIRSQDLADLYVRAIDVNPSAMVDKPHDADQVEKLLQALARFFLAQRYAIATVAAYAAGVLDARAEDGDF